MFYKSAGIDIDPNTFRPYVMCNCWHQDDKESMGMWDKYHLRNSGIAIRTTLENLRNSLPDEASGFIGQIKYVENHNLIKMPEAPSIAGLAHAYFFYKRTPFSYEKEVRAIIDVEPLLQEEPDDYGTSVEINVPTLIGQNSEVIVSPYADEWITSTLALIVEQYGFQFPVKRSNLLDPP